MIEKPPFSSVLFDPQDLPLLQEGGWCITYYKAGWRVVRAVKQGRNDERQALHRVMLGAPRGVLVDHKNGNGLDNRRENLRLCTHSQNQHNRSKQGNNTSGFKGVSWSKQAKKWETYIWLHNKRIGLGLYETAEQAAGVYASAAKALHGDFARTEDFIRDTLPECLRSKLLRQCRLSRARCTSGGPDSV